MGMYQLIDKKKMGFELSTEEIKWMISSYAAKHIEDYKMSAMLMAIYFQGMSDGELMDFTMAMAESGDMVDLSSIDGIKVDKHSTGGVGDKTTLIVGPIVAAAGGIVAKMSGRGLGFTGGTVDKLESIPGYRTTLSQEEFVRNVKNIGISMIGQSERLAAADKRLYALRDETAVVDSIPLIASSIMSKKLASGGDKILLDVTCGNGAFMKTREEAVLLAKTMVAIGERCQKETAALITNMDMPLGMTIGNAIEVEEAIQVLKGKGPDDLRQISIALAAAMLFLGDPKRKEGKQYEDMARETLNSGAALAKLKETIETQGGEVCVIEDTRLLKKSEFYFEVVAAKSGYMTGMDTKMWGNACGILGAGRETIDGQIDSGAGIQLLKKTGDSVMAGDTIAVLYSSSFDRLEEARKIIEQAYQIGLTQPKKEPLILAWVDKKGVEWL